MGLIKVVLTLLANLLGFLKDRQLIEAGKAEAKNEQSEATLEAVTAVRAPISDDERERVWARLQASRDKGRVPSDPVP
jgi:membrane glycosyltransferase